jgi:hypothetical protein
MFCIREEEEFIRVVVIKSEQGCCISRHIVPSSINGQAVSWIRISPTAFPRRAAHGKLILTTQAIPSALIHVVGPLDINVT